jgi:hypothetical protein
MRTIKAALALPILFAFGCAPTVADLPGASSEPIPFSSVRVVMNPSQVCVGGREIAYTNKLAAGFTLEGRIREMTAAAAQRGAEFLLIQTQPFGAFGDVNVQGIMYDCP